jgi:hypothetical protein
MPEQEQIRLKKQKEKTKTKSPPLLSHAQRSTFP